MRVPRYGARKRPVRVGNPYGIPMALMLICPKCEASTELRGTMDAWYLTWCPECERLWRLEVRSLLNDKPAEPWPPARRARTPPSP